MVGLFVDLPIRLKDNSKHTASNSLSLFGTQNSKDLSTDSHTLQAMDKLHQQS